MDLKAGGLEGMEQINLTGNRDEMWGIVSI